jgi:hypothetical protein
MYEKWEISFWIAALLSGNKKKMSKNKIRTIKMLQSPLFANE